jgi:hypothetical protein
MRVAVAAVAVIWPTFALAQSEYTGTTPAIVRQALAQAATQIKPCTGNEAVLLIQDVTPWGPAPGGSSNGAIVDELTAQNKNWCAIGSSQIGTVDLTNFSEVIVASAQTQTFYDNLFPATKGHVIHSAITDWVTTGGILIANLADCASGPGTGGGWATSPCSADVNSSYTFVGGLKHVHITSESNDIVVASHPLIAAGLPCVGGNCGAIVDTGQYTDLDGWSHSSHGIFENLPANTTVLIKEPTLFAPAAVTVDYPYGYGHVVATLTTTEWRYVGGVAGRLIVPQNKKLLANEIALGGLSPCGPPLFRLSPTLCQYAELWNSQKNTLIPHNTTPDNAGGHDINDYLVHFNTSKLGPLTAQETSIILPAMALFTECFESYRTDLYVPQSKTSDSGVTIAHGIDFGQLALPPKTYLSFLQGATLPTGSQTILWWTKTLADFGGKSKKPAVDAMTTVDGLTSVTERLALFTSSQFKDFENQIFTDRLTSASIAWNTLFPSQSFFLLSADVQTLLFDLTYQYNVKFTGSQFGKTFMTALQQSQWSDAASILTKNTSSDNRLGGRLALIAELNNNPQATLPHCP